MARKPTKHAAFWDQNWMLICSLLFVYPTVFRFAAPDLVAFSFYLSAFVLLSLSIYAQSPRTLRDWGSSPILSLLILSMLECFLILVFLRLAVWARSPLQYHVVSCLGSPGLILSELVLPQLILCGLCMAHGGPRTWNTNRRPQWKVAYHPWWTPYGYISLGEVGSSLEFQHRKNMGLLAFV